MGEVAVERMQSATQADNRPAVVAALMLTIGLAAIDATIVATAVPQIVADLGGFSIFPWIFSIYLLTQAVMVPIYGRLSDVFGRKPILLVGVAVFVAGSLACGFAWSMVALIVFRGLQGLGAGAILPTTSTIIGDLYDPAERGRIQGYISSVCGGSRRSSARPSAACSRSTGRGAASSGSTCRSASAPCGCSSGTCTSGSSGARTGSTTGAQRR